MTGNIKHQLGRVREFLNFYCADRTFESPTGIYSRVAEYFPTNLILLNFKNTNEVLIHHFYMYIYNQITNMQLLSFCNYNERVRERCMSSNA